MHSLSLPIFDPIEFVRGFVSSLSLTAAGVVHEIHIGKIQENFSRSDLSSQALKLALNAISSLREIEHIGKGYWLPTPTRVVYLGNETALLLSIASTDELKRHFSSVRRAGLGRLVAMAQVSHLPTQSLKSWCGTYEVDTATWARTLIKSVKNDFRPSIVQTGLEAFSVKSVSRPPYITHHEPVWLPIRDSRILVWNSVSLFRSRIGFNHYRYFLGIVTGSIALLEGPSVKDNLSLQFGLASLIGKPLTVSVRSKVNSIYLKLPLTVPSSVKRLLSALCEINPHEFGYVWQCHKAECWPTIKSAIQHLGCEIIDYE